MTKPRVVLSADRLGIKPYEHQALTEIRESFANRIFYHDRDIEMLKPDGFNMNVILSEDECGTTACIGGWMFLAMERDRTNPCPRAHQYIQTYRSRALGPLFFPFTDINRRDMTGDEDQPYDFPFELMPPEFALAAIDNFLATGDPDWPAVTQSCA
jgi:hypothetical protein